jgi:hypothetical protein
MTVLPSLARFLNVVTTKKAAALQQPIHQDNHPIDNISKKQLEKVLDATETMQVQSH